jgi:hypothetical protein
MSQSQYKVNPNFQFPILDDDFRAFLIGTEISPSDSDPTPDDFPELDPDFIALLPDDEADS